MGKLLLGIDLGTSAVKVLLVDSDGIVHGRGSAEYPLLTPQTGHVEQRPEDWWQAVVAAVREATARSGGGSIAAVGLSGQMHGVVLLDGAGEVVTPAVIWPDQRSAVQVAEITQLVGPRRLIEITGSPVATGFLAATVRWFQQQRPALWQRVDRLLLPKDYIRVRLTGMLATDPSDGSGALLLDVQARDWSSGLLKLLEIDPAQLPPVTASDAPGGALTAGVAQELGLTPGTPVVVGAADTACSALGAGAVDAGMLLLTISTGGQLIQPVSTPAMDSAGRIHTFCSALDPVSGPGWYQMGAMLSAGNALRWLRADVFEDTSPDAYQRMTAAAADVPIGADGLLFLPYLAGERTPHMDPTARAVFSGLTLGHGRSEMVRAVMEGVTFACYDGFQVLRQLGAQPHQIILAGGGARSTLWRQMVADVFGLPVSPLVTAEQSALGAALLAGAGIGCFNLTAAARAWANYGPVVEPDPAVHQMYAEIFGRFRALYARNKGHF